MLPSPEKWQPPRAHVPPGTPPSCGPSRAGGASIHGNTSEWNLRLEHRTCTAGPQLRYAGQSLQHGKGYDAEVSHPHRYACQDSVQDTEHPISHAERPSFKTLPALCKNHSTRILHHGLNQPNSTLGTVLAVGIHDQNCVRGHMFVDGAKTGANGSLAPPIGAEPQGIHLKQRPGLKEVPASFSIRAPIVHQKNAGGHTRNRPRCSSRDRHTREADSQSLYTGIRTTTRNGSSVVPRASDMVIKTLLLGLSCRGRVPSAKVPQASQQSPPAGRQAQ